MNMYICFKCGKEKPENEFPWDKRRNRIGRPCRQCDRERTKKYHETHRQQEKEYRDKNKEKIKQWFADHPEHVEKYRSNYNRLYRIKKEYGLSPQQYDEMFHKQNGLCAICGKPETQTYNSTKRVGHLCVDHNHATGKIRGLLCMKCNRGVGLFQEDKALLRGAANYLEEYDNN